MAFSSALQSSEALASTMAERQVSTEAICRLTKEEVEPERVTMRVLRRSLSLITRLR